MAVSGGSMPFIKNLASSDRKIRTQALDTLQTFLTAKYAAAGTASTTPLTLRDAQKLWAGLFYALWMADRAPAQQRLSAELAGLPVAVRLPDAAVAVWLRAFWATMSRQWTTGIDVLRMDKFMLLVRRVVAAQLAWLGGEAEVEAGKETDTEAEAKRKRAAATAEEGLRIFEEWPWNPEAEASMEEDKEDDGDDDNMDDDDDDVDEYDNRRRKMVTLHVPVGLTLHVLDIWVDEAERLGWTGASAGDDAGDNAGDNDHSTPRIDLLRRLNHLVETLAAQTTAPAVRKRAREALADDRLPWNAKTVAPSSSGSGSRGLEGQADDDDDDAMDDDASWDGFND